MASTKEEDTLRMEIARLTFFKHYALHLLVKDPEGDLLQSERVFKGNANVNKKTIRLLEEEGVLYSQNVRRPMHYGISSQTFLRGVHKYFEDHYQSFMKEFNPQDLIGVDQVVTPLKGTPSKRDSGWGNFKDLSYIDLLETSPEEVLYIYHHKDEYVFSREEGITKFKITCVHKDLKDEFIRSSLRYIALNAYKEDPTMYIVKSFGIKWHGVLDNLMWFHANTKSNLYQGALGYKQALKCISSSRKKLQRYENMLRELEVKTFGLSDAEVFKQVVCFILKTFLKNAPKIAVLKVRHDDKENTQEEIDLAESAKQVLSYAQDFTWEKLFEVIDITPFLKLFNSAKYKQREEKQPQEG